MLAITKYADRLDKDLDMVDYLPQVKIQQRNWIGRREGALIKFKIQNAKGKNANQNSKYIEVFTTRADTLFGATYLVLAPENPHIENWKLKIENWDEVQKYIEEAKKKKEIERTALHKEKTGVELKGVRAVNPGTGEEISIWVADYVLAGYGTGAIMAVPAHDERDFEFAKKFKLPVRSVVVPCFVQTTEPGKVVEGKPFVERNAIFAIVKHWEKDLYIGLKWKKVAWKTLITGGIEKGDTAETAAIKEIIEETGYTHPKLVKDLGLVHSKFYHPPKGENRFGHFQMLYFELADGACNELSEKEKEIHDVLWLSKEEIGKFLTPASHIYAWELLTEGKHVYEGEGILTNSGRFDGLSSEKARDVITEFSGGKKQVTYRLRDWIFSRQRYWGDPIPLVFCESCKKLAANPKSEIRNPKSPLSEGERLNPGWVPVPEEELPVELPNVEKYQPTDTGESPLANIAEWVNTICPKCGGAARRETDVMPNWAGSSWYYIAYCISENLKSQETISKQIKSTEIQSKLKYWLPVDWYNGGMEHTTLHLLYSRFWHKFLYDIKVVGTTEPYKKRTSHGLILAEGGEKMSKSKGNVINPDDIVERLGADTLRLYEMFMGPFDQTIAWNTDNIAGVRRFIERVWKLRTKVDEQSTAKNVRLEQLSHKTIKKIGEDIETLKFNTAVSQLMIFANELEKLDKIPSLCYDSFLRMMALFAPYVAEELWHDLGRDGSVHEEPWPLFDEKKITGDVAIIAVQINGKVRDSFEVSAGESEEIVLNKALEREAVRKWLGGKEPRKTVYVRDRLLSIVT